VISYLNNSEIQATYNRLWTETLPSLQGKTIQADSNLSDKLRDSRKGITLIFRPSKKVQALVMTFLREIEQVEPSLYFYKSTELHTTILSIISCSTDFDADGFCFAPYIKALQNSIEPMSPFLIHYRGLTASPEGIMIQGFPEDSTLEKLRNNIREYFRKSHIRNTLDKRYKVHTAHMTCIRFQQPALKNSDKFIRLLNEYRDLNFGTSEIKDLELVLNDWYMSNEKTEVLKSYSLTIN
jgi:2'-5' RNA ligase